MPLNEIPKYFNPETRHLVDAALDAAWQELKKNGFVDADPARMKLATTIVALAAVGETDPDKLKRFALHAAHGASKTTKATTAKSAALPR
jgi:hypothetical protein